MTAMDIFQRDDLVFPRSPPEFQQRFPDDAACAAYLERTRWPDGLPSLNRSVIAIEAQQSHTIQPITAGRQTLGLSGT
jgi:hypothetical protein